MIFKLNRNTKCKQCRTWMFCLSDFPLKYFTPCNFIVNQDINTISIPISKDCQFCTDSYMIMFYIGIVRFLKTWIINITISFMYEMIILWRAFYISIMDSLQFTISSMRYIPTKHRVPIFKIIMMQDCPGLNKSKLIIQCC
ncbi:unnamed protein product [Paramecium pentaurelia]|uniref:Uncharacterized protein n=1 Tax=Paramecium pentaurelia TaxID=43138 RepID=A0A8S1VK54_9CILI|nr:unnamed protein product [Paramecium pentaurelia]